MQCFRTKGARHSMVNRVCGPILGALLGTACLTLPPLAGLFAEALAHGAHEHFAAGEPGDPKKPFRVVKVTMLEDGKKMLFEPAVVEVHVGEQVRFEIFNVGSWNHEFVLATQTANREHAELMKKFPDMEHDDPNALRLAPFASGAILWEFTKPGAFEYACLIPGHLEAGMRGQVIVK
jgi:uncharacterized cupredoxin-like copper-binding protein